MVAASSLTLKNTGSYTPQEGIISISIVALDNFKVLSMYN